MKGLLLKDYYILWSQKKTFVMFLFIALMFLFTSRDSTSAVSYSLFIIAILSMSTISYDDHGNGLQHLFLLPPGRKTYVTAKYLFCLINTITAWLVLSVLGSMIGRLKQTPDNTFIFTELFLLLCVCLILIGIMMPLHLKYGGEKARIVLSIFVGLIVGTSFLLKQFSFPLDRILEGLNDISLPSVNVVFLIAAAAVFGISYLCSLRVVEKKEF